MSADLETVSFRRARGPRTWDELRAEAVAAIRDAANDFSTPDPADGSVGRMADAVLALIDDEAVNRMAAQFVSEARFRSMEIRAGRIEVSGIEAREIAAMWVGAARTLLKDAENYSETEMVFTDHDREQAYAFTVQKVGKQTPHQLRRKAETERDAALAEIERLKARYANPEGDDNDGDRHPDPVRCFQDSGRREEHVRGLLTDPDCL